MRCPNCGFDSPPDMIFCGMCGVRLARACPSCGFVNPLQYRFCGQCGTLLASEPVAAQLPQPQLPTETEVSARPSPPPLQLEGERRLATVIFADVTGSTDLLEQIGTEAWVELMNRVFQILGSEIYRFGGEIDQFRGDGLVAFFGTTTAHEDDPERAVLAALAMQEAIKPYAVELAEREGIELLLRVGVNTGEVIVASIGDSRRYSEDTAMGEAIALADRMQTAAEPGTVLVSENTYPLAQSQFEWEPLGEIRVKGVSQPIAVYRPLVPLAGADQLYRLQARRPSIPLIGRDAECQILKSCVEDLYDGRGGIVILTGDAGLGKSSLVAEVRQHVARQGALLARVHDGGTPPSSSLAWLHGRCRSYGQSWPYSMWLDLLRDWVGIHHREPEEEAQERLRREAEALWDAHLPEDYPYLASIPWPLLEETFPQQVAYLDAEEPRKQFFVAVRSWLEAMVKRGPLVLDFGDVHWADASSLDLLKHCLPLCDREALLWLIVFRPDRTSPVWEFRHYVETEYPHRLTTLMLPPLTKAQSREFMEYLMGPDVLPVETQDLVLSKAEGNPYYIGELVQSLITRGVLEQDAVTGQWSAKRAVDSLDLPDSLQTLLLARIDSLSPEGRRVLQMAAVIGRVFWSKVLRALVGDAAGLKEHLTALQRAQLIEEGRRLPDLGREYVFKFNLIRDAAYDSLLTTQRVMYHRQVADCLEQLFAEETLPQYYAMLAHHYRQAGKPRRELSYTLQAAEQAKNMYANAEALRHYMRAHELLDEMEAAAASDEELYAIRTRRFEVLSGRREVRFVMGDFEGGWADAQALLPLAPQLEDGPVWLIDALLQQPGVGGWRSSKDLDAGIPMAQRALTLAQQLGDHRREMQSLVAIARQRLWVSDPKAWEFTERALELARQLGDQRCEAGLLVGMGKVYASSDPERSMEYLEAALPICQALDDKMAELDLLELIGMQLEDSGDYYRRLKECHEKQLRISREIGYRPAEARALMFCGQVQGLYLGDYDAGLALLEESLRIWEGTPVELYPLLRVAQIQGQQGKYDEALETLERASYLSERHEEQIALTGLDLVSAILYNGLGDEAHLRMGLDLATQNLQVSVGKAQLSRQYQMVAACEATAAHLGLASIAADAAERQAHLRQALESSQAALDAYQSFGFVRPIECISEEILYRRSLALAANGRGAEAGECLQRAYDETMRKHDLIPPDSPFRRTYLENIPLHREIRSAVLPAR